MMNSVMNKIQVNHKTVFNIQLCFILFSLFYLTKTDTLRNMDALSNVYVLCFTSGLLLSAYNEFINKPILSKRKVKIYLAAAFLFSLCIILANYQFLMNSDRVVKFINTCVKVFIVFIGSACTGWNILLFFDTISVSATKEWHETAGNKCQELTQEDEELLK